MGYGGNECIDLKMYGFPYNQFNKIIHQALVLFRLCGLVFFPRQFCWKKWGFGNQSESFQFSWIDAFGYQVAVYGIRPEF